MYEYSTWDTYAAGEVITGTVGSFYNNIEVQKALNVPVHRLGMGWEGCIPELTDVDLRRRRSLSKSTSLFKAQKNVEHLHRKLFMDNDTPWSVVPYIAQLLDEAKIDVLMYSGDRDIICCTQGTEEALRKMDWSGTREAAPGHLIVNSHENAWTQATRSLWVYNNTYPAGYIKTYKNLQLLTVYNAGHMVPYNQPGPALDMMERFLRGESFHDRPLVTFASHAHESKSRSERKEQQSANKVLQESITGGSTFTFRVATESIPPTATLLLTVSVAFLLGFVIARFTTRVAPSMQVQLSSANRRGYGSIESVD